VTGLPLSRRSMLGIAGGLIPLTGCSLLIGQPAPQLYRLTPRTAGAENGPKLRSQLVIDTPLAPQSLDTDRIALTLSPTRLDYYAGSAWTDRAPVLLQGLLVEAFENSGRLAAVARDSSALNPDYLLATELRDFEASYAGTGDQPPIVVVNLIATLVRMPSRHVIGSVLIAEQAAAAGRSLDSIVEAFDTAVGKVLTRIVGWTLRHMAHGR
jgi:cholesterol transport system auxiliary component